MSATALIVFREVLEAAMVIGIVLAATRGVRGRSLWIAAGLGLGLIGAVLVAVFAEAIGEAAEGMGQEVFNAAVLFAAVVMLGWHNAWMSRAGRAMAAELNAFGTAVRRSERPVTVLAVIVGLAVLREGSEVVLFLYGIAAQGNDQAAMLVGGVIGLALGIAAGAVIYFGLVRVAGRYLFAATGALILFLAAGMAAQGAKFLAQGGYLPALGQSLWDSSALISDQGSVGTLLHVLVGYTARPDGIQLVFYFSTLVIIGVLMYVFRRPRPAVPLALAGLTLLMVAIPPVPVHAADLKVYSPIVEEGEFGIEERGNFAVDSDPAQDGGQSQRYEIEYTPNAFWHTALVGKANKDPGGKLRLEASAWENIFQLFPQGQHWMNLGVYLEYERAHLKGGHDALEAKILAEKVLGPVALTLNPIFEKELGRGAKATEFKYAAQIKWRLRPEFESAIEAFGDLGEIRDLDPASRQRHQIGPAILGKVRLSTTTALKYEAGYLLGLSSGGSASSTVKWLVELEHRF